eukprot:c337_g1_i1 orf=1-252(-)
MRHWAVVIQIERWQHRDQPGTTTAATAANTNLEQSVQTACKAPTCFSVEIREGSSFEAAKCAPILILRAVVVVQWQCAERGGLR